MNNRTSEAWSSIRLPAPGQSGHRHPGRFRPCPQPDLRYLRRRSLSTRPIPISSRSSSTPLTSSMHPRPKSPSPNPTWAILAPPASSCRPCSTATACGLLLQVMYGSELISSVPALIYQAKDSDRPPSYNSKANSSPSTKISARVCISQWNVLKPCLWTRWLGPRPLTRPNPIWPPRSAARRAPLMRAELEVPKAPAVKTRPSEGMFPPWWSPGSSTPLPPRPGASWLPARSARASSTKCLARARLQPVGGMPSEDRPGLL